MGFSNFSNIVNVSVGGVLNANPNAVSFSESIKPIISTNCKRCHPGYENYATAYNVAENIYDRVSRKVGDTQKMPQNGKLTDVEIELIKSWIDTEKNP